MKYLLPISLAVLAVTSRPVRAEPAPEKDVGIGLAVGVATGPNVEVRTSPWTHVAIGVGMTGRDANDLRLQLDHAWRLNGNVEPARSVAVPVYIGLGAFMIDRKWGPTDLGVRMPIGMQVEFARAPLQLFGEVAPELLAVRFQDDWMQPPSRELLNVTGLLGVRAAF